MGGVHVGLVYIACHECGFESYEFKSRPVNLYTPKPPAGGGGAERITSLCLSRVESRHAIGAFSSNLVGVSLILGG